MKLFAACALAAVGIIGLASPGRAQTNWICTYSVQGYSEIVRYQIEGDNVLLNGKVHYRILQDNNVALIAALSAAEIISTKPWISTVTVMINKLSLAYRIILATIDFPTETYEGRCVTE
jgi:hypothetical protein